jgi:hypothetical protein
MNEHSVERQDAKFDDETILSIPVFEEEELRVEDFDTESEISDYGSRQMKGKQAFLPPKSHLPSNFELILTPKTLVKGTKIDQ